MSAGYPPPHPYTPLAKASQKSKPWTSPIPSRLPLALNTKPSEGGAVWIPALSAIGAGFAIGLAAIGSGVGQAGGPKSGSLGVCKTIRLFHKNRDIFLIPVHHRAQTACLGRFPAYRS